MVHRNNFEKNFRRLFSEFKYGTTTWSGLASGVLAGRYNDGNIPEDSRLSNYTNAAFLINKYLGKNKEETCAKLRKLKEYADELGTSQAVLAIAWVAANTDVSTCILGFSKLSQAEENFKALSLLKKWTPEIDQKVRAIMGNDPEPELNWRTWTPQPQRRDVALYKP